MDKMIDRYIDGWMDGWNNSLTNHVGISEAHDPDGQHSHAVFHQQRVHRSSEKELEVATMR